MPNDPNAGAMLYCDTNSAMQCQTFQKTVEIRVRCLMCEVTGPEPRFLYISLFCRAFDNGSSCVRIMAFGAGARIIRLSWY